MTTIAVTAEILRDSLRVAVPFEIANLRKYGGPTDWHVELAHRIGTRIVSPGIEDLMFPPTKKSHAADLFADLSWALAVLSFMPGGVRFQEILYEANPEREAATPVLPAL